MRRSLITATAGTTTTACAQRLVQRSCWAAVRGGGGRRRISSALSSASSFSSCEASTWTTHPPGGCGGNHHGTLSLQQQTQHETKKPLSSSFLTTTTTTTRRWHNSHSHSHSHGHHGHGHGHGSSSSGDASFSPPTVPPGPRTYGCALGFDVAKATQNILRLLEASHGPYATTSIIMTSAAAAAVESMEWHERALSWHFDYDDDDDMAWMATSPFANNNHHHSPSSAMSSPQLLSLHMSDDRTALAKLLDNNSGQERYLSLLRLEEATPAHDGWRIVRQAVADTPAAMTTANTTAAAGNDLMQITETLQKYLSIEHGGGGKDAAYAHEHFLAPQFSMLTVGTAAASDGPPSAWSAPAGSFLEISRDTYLEGVASQTPHVPEAATHDAILAIDVAAAPSNQSGLASAIVRVGNGAQTALFVDHLILGKQKDGGTTTMKNHWQILSKVFSSQAWPIARK